MRSVLKKVAGIIVAVTLIFGMFSCVNPSGDNSGNSSTGGVPDLPPAPVMETVATPIFSLAAGIVDSGTNVKITCATEGAKIYYTTDESDPTVSSKEFTAPINLTTAVTIKAIAVKEGMNDSAVASVSYTIKYTVATPVFSLTAGVVDSGTNVKITCATDDAKIYYTTDESEPTASGTEYTAPISITDAVTIKAIAVNEGMNDSPIACVSYSIYTPNYSVGDFILKDGSKKAKAETPESGTVAAVIFKADTSTTPALGVGIVHNMSGLSWCIKTASGYSTYITELEGTQTSGYMDGSNSWELLVAACEDLKNATTETFETVAQNYPAFNYCRKYGTKNDLEGELVTGWYLPTIAELNTIYQNITIVDASLEKVGGNQFKDSLDSQRLCYLSCC